MRFLFLLLLLLLLLRSRAAFAVPSLVCGSFGTGCIVSAFKVASLFLEIALRFGTLFILAMLSWGFTAIWHTGVMALLENIVGGFFGRKWRKLVASGVIGEEVFARGRDSQMTSSSEGFTLDLGVVLLYE